MMLQQQNPSFLPPDPHSFEHAASYGTSHPERDPVTKATGSRNLITAPNFSNAKGGPGVELQAPPPSPPPLIPLASFGVIVLARPPVKYLDVTSPSFYHPRLSRPPRPLQRRRHFWPPNCPPSSPICIICITGNLTQQAIPHGRGGIEAELDEAPRPCRYRPPGTPGGRRRHYRTG